jgi:osmoprotectant transport system substrate-binding protein
MRLKPRMFGIGIAAAALLLTGCSSGGEEKLTVGAFNFTESQILAELYAGVLAEAGYDVSILQSTNREVLEPALEAGEVQVVPEYVGTFAEFLNRKVNGPDAPPVASGDVDATWQAARELAEPLGITVLDPSPAADQNAFAVTAAFADANGLRSLSDLAAFSQGQGLRLGGPPECPERPFCQPGLEGTYGMVIGEFVPLDAGGPLTKQALEQGSIDIGLVFSSDGGVAALNLKVLDDDLKLQQVDNIVPAVQTSVLTPAITDALNALSAAMTTDDLIAMNKAVDIDRETPAQVAKAFLVAKGLISG